MPAGSAGIIGRRNVKRRNSRRNAGTRNLARPTPIGIASATKAGSVITIVFNQPVSLKGVPQYTTNLPGVTAASARDDQPDDPRADLQRGDHDGNDVEHPERRSGHPELFGRLRFAQHLSR